MRRIVLASASPRRRDLLAQLGLSFSVSESNIDESVVLEEGKDPEETVRILALAKARAIAEGLADDLLVLGADTVVVVDGQVLGKPSSVMDASRMLGLIQGRSHNVYTGVAIVHSATNKILTGVECTTVHMRSLSREEIEAYVATGEPMDKAGAYAIQGLGATIVTGVNGCFYNVVGLPLARVATMLREFGVELLNVQRGVPQR